MCFFKELKEAALNEWIVLPVHERLIGTKYFEIKVALFGGDRDFCYQAERTT